MKKTASRRIFAVLSTALMGATLAGMAANAQTQDAEIAASARIYGYDLAAGNWTEEQAHCALMPVELVHYLEVFPDGTESRFTAVVPRESGHVRIVPVLYHNATPYLPAPRNPRNYVLFNQLIRGRAAKGTWMELGACYAALTGASPGPGSASEIAGAPAPRVQIDPQGKNYRVTFATRESRTGYKVWNISFDRFGRVTSAGSEDESLYAAKAPPPAIHPAAPERHERAAVRRPAQATHPALQEQAGRPTSSAFRAHETLAPQPPLEEAGWKFIPTPPDPPSKFIPEPPQPSETPLPK